MKTIQFEKQAQWQYWPQQFDQTGKLQHRINTRNQEQG